MDNFSARAVRMPEVFNYHGAPLGAEDFYDFPA